MNNINYFIRVKTYLEKAKTTFTPKGLKLNFIYLKALRPWCSNPYCHSFSLVDKAAEDKFELNF